MIGRSALTAALVLVGLASARADDPAVTIADLPAYRAALAARVDPASAAPATFRDLWERPDAFQGRPVLVEGRLARLFRQPAVGRFPALAEGWITSPRGEPTCVVFPTGDGRAVPATGEPVRFAGTFLRKVTYPGGDAARVAPLVVGPTPPVAAAGDSSGSTAGPALPIGRPVDWVMGLVVGVAVLGALLRRHLDRPLAGPATPIGPAPLFRDGADDDRDPFDPGDDGHVDPR